VPGVEDDMEWFSSLRDCRNYTSQHYGQWPDEALRWLADYQWANGVRDSGDMPSLELASTMMSEWLEGEQFSR
jgi:hypothetical protein